MMVSPPGIEQVPDQTADLVAESIICWLHCLLGGRRTEKHKNIYCTRPCKFGEAVSHSGRPTGPLLLTTPASPSSEDIPFFRGHGVLGRPVHGSFCSCRDRAFRTV